MEKWLRIMHVLLHMENTSYPRKKFGELGRHLHPTTILRIIHAYNLHARNTHSNSTAAKEKQIGHALFFHILDFCHTIVLFFSMNSFSTWQTMQNQTH